MGSYGEEEYKRSKRESIRREIMDEVSRYGGRGASPYHQAVYDKYLIGTEEVQSSHESSKRTKEREKELERICKEEKIERQKMEEKYAACESSGGHNYKSHTIYYEIDEGMGCPEELYETTNICKRCGHKTYESEREPLYGYR